MGEESVNSCYWKGCSDSEAKDMMKLMVLRCCSSVSFISTTLSIQKPGSTRTYVCKMRIIYQPNVL
jgi:hypothetical protein